ncbi:MAG: SusC/RagA family TonB-linked outer membrane protein, partial [Bacteroidales bacterium]|nr:SusC/RagA family TonB-linked outer membrane protein [Bacteroidales bacterium]
YLLIITFLSIQILLYSQDTINITGTVTNGVSSEPVSQVLISISGTSLSVTTDENGKFQLSNVYTNALVTAKHPDFVSREIYLTGRENLEIKIIPLEYKSNDDLIVTPYADKKAKEIPSSFEYFSKSDVQNTSETTFARAIQGKATGVRISTLSGMPGAMSVFSIRGPSTISGRNDPVVIIDGVLHEIHYSRESPIDGFVHNPLEMVDIDDIESITILKDAQSYLGSMGANGVIVINTEEKKETSSAIRVHVFQGFTMPSSKMSLMNSEQFNDYFNQQIASSELSQDEINARFPFLTPGNDPNGLYSNNTDWQDEIFTSGLISKYHIFLKGGDDVGNLNISTGYLKYNGIIDNTSYSRFNLRVNSKINITNRFSFIPNVKMSTSDSYLMDQGPSSITNPILAANLKPPITRPYSDKSITNDQYLSDVGAFGVSNPLAIIRRYKAQNKNYQFLASGKANYNFSSKFSVSTSLNLAYNNSRDNLFIPDKGLVEIDSAKNSMDAMVTEFRSLQNNLVMYYSTDLDENLSLDLRIGNRIMRSTYEYDMGNDLNSPTDDFTTLGSGAEDQFLRETKGSARSLNIVSYYSIADFSFFDKYYLNASVTLDGNSAINKNNRYNLYYSVAGAWNLASGNVNMLSRFDEVKIRASYGTSGNIFNDIYDYSRLFYVGRRLNDIGVIVIESIPNENMEVEKKSTIDLGFDLSTSGENFNTSIDLFYETVNNLIIRKKVSSAYGFPDIYDNSGKMANMGAELTADYRFKTGKSFWTIGFTAASMINKVTSLDQNLGEGEQNIILSQIVDEHNNKIATLVTEVGGSMYSFYGYETDGIYTSSAEANSVIGPEGRVMQVGDVKYKDNKQDGIIDENDLKNIGSPLPLVYGSLFTSFKKGRLMASANIGYSVGNKIFNYVAMITNSAENFYNQNKDIMDSNAPRIVYGDPSGNNVFSDRWIEDGSYARLKSVTISYDIPTSNKFFKTMKVYLSGSNLITFTKYSGYDPEFYYNNNIMYTGMDFGKIPFGRSIIVGIKFEL